MENTMMRLLSSTALILILAAAPAYAGLFGSNGSKTPPAIAAKLNKPVPTRLLATLEKASKAALGMGTTPSPVYLKAINGPRVAKGNQVGMLYIGADFCPYCAGQRWALILTLVRFGQFSGLEYMASTAHDVYPNTPTFSFQHATYKSKYVVFRPVETRSRTGKQLEKPTAAENDIFNKFDAPPYMPDYGGIPFVYLDGQYLVTRPFLMPNELSGMDWDQAAVTLANPSSQLFQNVMPQVNALTAAICRLDGGDPDSVCSAPGVTAANGALFHLQPSSGT